MDWLHLFQKDLRIGGTIEASTVREVLSMAAKKGAILAGRKGPPGWLRNGLPTRHSEPWVLAWLPCGNFGCPTATEPLSRHHRKFSYHLRSASLRSRKIFAKLLEVFWTRQRHANV